MSASFLIIDGYNLMHAVGMARERYGPGGLERQRQRFLAFLVRQVPRAQRSRTTVVFDAIGAPQGLPRQSFLEQIEVLFASPGEEADALIEQLIATHSAPRQVLVVSSDHRLQRAARRRRARFTDSEEFIARLARQAVSRTRRESPDPPEKRGKKLSADEVARWLAEFGPLPEAEETDLQPDINDAQFWLDRLRDLDADEDIR